MTIPLQFASLYDGHEVFLWPDCPLDLCTNFIFVMWSLYEIGSALLLIFIDSIVLCSSAVGSTIHKHTGRWM